MFPIIKITTVQKSEKEFAADGVTSDFEDNPSFSKREQREIDRKEKELATAADIKVPRKKTKQSSNQGSAGGLNNQMSNSG